MADHLSTFNSKDIYKFAKKLSIFCLLLFVLDFLIGYALYYVYIQTEAGNSGAQINYAINHPHDIVIFGASKAFHGYVPAIISSNLNLSVYNAGDDAKRASYQEALLHLILEKYKPKLVIYDIFYRELEDVEIDEGIADLYPYYRNQKVKEIITRRDPWFPVKTISRIYPFNANILPILKSLMAKPRTDGYRAIYGSRLQPIIEQETTNKQKSKPEPEKVVTKVPEKASIIKQSFVNFVSVCQKNKIQIIFVCSPRWKFDPDQKEINEEVQKISRDYDIPIIKISQDNNSVFKNPELFYDVGHLNHSGAVVFSKILNQRLKVIFKENSKIQQALY